MNRSDEKQPPAAPQKPAPQQVPVGWKFSDWASI